MPITQAMVTSFKVALFSAEMDFSADTSDVFKIALYTSAANMNATTMAYSPTNEVSGPGYTAGGQILTVSQVPTSSGTTAFISFDNVSWTTATFTTRGALIYREAGGAAVATLDFGADITATGGSFSVNFPAADASSAILRIG